MNYYLDIYETINAYIFGGTLASGTAEHLAVSLFSLCACLFAVALPFIIIWRVMRLILGD